MAGDLCVVGTGGRLPAEARSLSAPIAVGPVHPVVIDLLNEVHGTEDQIVCGLPTVLEKLASDPEPDTIESFEFPEAEGDVATIGDEHDLVIVSVYEGTDAVRAAEIDLDRTVHAVDCLVGEPLVLLQIGGKKPNGLAAKILR